MAVKKTYFDTYHLLEKILITKVQVTDLGGKSSANLTYFGSEKTWLWHLPSTIGYVSDQSTSDEFRWQKFG